MNYYNPYFYTMPNNIANTTIRTGLFNRLFGRNISFSGILNSTQKVLNFANQAIPLVKQVKPMIGNAKTMFKLMNEFKKVEHPHITNNQSSKNINQIKQKDNKINISNDTKGNSNNGPQFFV